MKLSGDIAFASSMALGAVVCLATHSVQATLCVMMVVWLVAVLLR